MKFGVATLRPLLGVALLAGTAATGAQAQIPFLGQTLACFSLTPGTCTPTAGSFHSFYGNNTVTDVSGRIHFNTTAVNLSVTPGAPPITFSLGKLSTGTQFAPGIPVPIHEYFSLAVALTNPPPGTTSSFLGLLSGQLTFLHDPANPTIQLSFTGPGLNGVSGPHPMTAGGTYTLTALNGAYNSDKNFQQVWGTAAATVTPEPVSMMLFGTGLSGLALLRRRRRKTADSAEA